jgi:hypothetical protein
MPGDNCTEPWTSGNITYEIPLQCEIWVRYKYRTCGDINEIYLSGISVHSLYGDCDNLDDDVLIKESICQIFLLNKMGFSYSYDGFPEIGNAVVTMASCWASLIYDDTYHPWPFSLEHIPPDFPSDPNFYINPIRKVLLNCDFQDCCYQKYHVDESKEGLKIYPIGVPYSPNDCNGAEYPDVSNYPSGYIQMGRCMPHCEDLKIYRSISFERKSDFSLSEAYESIKITSSCLSDNNIFNVKIESLYDIELKAQLVSSNGEVLSDYIFNYHSGTFYRNIDLSMLPSGVYFLNLFNGTTFIKTLKFVVL